MSVKESVEEDLHKLQKKVKDKFNELKNLYKEVKCYRNFIKDKKLNDEFELYRNEFYALRKWKNDKIIINGNNKDEKCISCGNEIPKVIVINTNAYTLALYNEWKENGKELCIECFSKSKKGFVDIL